MAAQVDRHHRVPGEVAGHRVPQPGVGRQPVHEEDRSTVAGERAGRETRADRDHLHKRSLWPPGRYRLGEWAHDFRGSPAGALRHPAHRGLVPSRQLPRCGAAVGGHAGRPRRVLLRPRPARAHRRARPEDARRAHPQRRRPAPRAGAGSGAVHGVRPVARARARRAAVGAGLHHGVRRGEPDDAVQGQDRTARQRPGQRGPVHLPDPAGRGHPALPGRPRAGRRGPAAARRAHPRSRAAVQQPVRAGVHRAGALHPRRVRPRSRTCRTRRRR